MRLITVAQRFASRPLSLAAVGTALWFTEAAAVAQDQAWIGQFGSAGIDEPFASTPDGVGGVYLGGYTTGDLGSPNAGSEDAWLARYDGAGNQLWIRQLGTALSDAALAAAPDASGGLYLSGQSNGNLGGPSTGQSDAWLARFDSSGNQIWLRQIGSAGADAASGIAQDGQGGAYVCGQAEGNLGGMSAGGADVWVARYDNQGNQLWVVQFGTSSWDGAVAATPDGSGGVFVVGSTGGNLGGQYAGSNDAWIARLDSGGTQLWIRQLGTSGSDGAFAASSDGTGGVYISGGTTGNLGGPLMGSEDAWLSRYDNAGNQLWIRQIGSLGSDAVRASATGESGVVYIAGQTTDNLGGVNAGSWDAWLARYDSTGTALNISQLGTGGIDSALALAPNGLGGVYVSGETQGDLGGANSGSFDVWLAHYDICVVDQYCVGAINSTGQGAAIGHQGSTSISQNDLVLTASGCPPSQPGIFIMGTLQTQAPFGDGWLCLTGGVYRLLPAVFLSPSGAGSLQLDFTNATSPAALITPGSDWQFQFWYRDPQVVGSGFNLSNGLSAHFCP